MFRPKGIDKECIRKTAAAYKEKDLPFTKEQLKDLFWRYDKNKDGRLSRKELKDAFKSLGAFIPQYRARRALHHADENGDGYVSDDEVDELVKYAFELGYTVISTI